MHRVGIVVFDGVTLLDVSGPGDVFGQATKDGLPYQISLISPDGGPVTTSSGLQLTGTVAATQAGKIDSLMVAGGPHLPVQPVDPQLLNAVSQLLPGAGRVASVCTGAFVLAELGLLDGRTATTHWRHTDTLALRYPQVRVEHDVIHCQDENYFTSAGITAGIDLTLALVEQDHGPAAARNIAQELVVFMNRPGGQAQFASGFALSSPKSEVLRSVTQSVIAQPAAEHSLSTMAATAHVSERHLTRLFRTELNSTPARWVERIRLDRSQRLLLDGHSVTETAQRSGFGNDETLRRAFARQLGITPSEYKRRFASTIR